MCLYSIYLIVSSKQVTAMQQYTILNWFFDFKLSHSANHIP